MKQADTVQGEAKRLQGTDDTETTSTRKRGPRAKSWGEHVQDRDRWFEFLSAVTSVRRRMNGKDGKPVVDLLPSGQIYPEELEEEIMQRKESKSGSDFHSQQVDDVVKWFVIMKGERLISPDTGTTGAPDTSGAAQQSPRSVPAGARRPFSGSSRRAAFGRRSQRSRPIVQIYGRHFDNVPSGAASSAYCPQYSADEIWPARTGRSGRFLSRPHQAGKPRL